MTRTTRSLSLVLSLAAVLACGGDATSPNAESAEGGVNLKVMTLAKTASAAHIVVMPSGGWFALGKHAIRFPKHAICALSSSYGPTEWDKPCVPAQGPVSFRVQIVQQDGREWLDFTPAVRFVPTTRTSEYVMLYMRADNLSNDLTEDQLQILWSPAIGVPGIDESIADPTQRTRINWGAGILSRRIKHFSGYSVYDGPVCPGPLCQTEVPGEELLLQADVSGDGSRF